jgi:hypothetical protein
LVCDTEKALYLLYPVTHKDSLDAFEVSSVACEYIISFNTPIRRKKSPLAGETLLKSGKAKVCNAGTAVNKLEEILKFIEAKKKLD